MNEYCYQFICNVHNTYQHNGEKTIIKKSFGVEIRKCCVLNRSKCIIQSDSKLCGFRQKQISNMEKATDR